MNKTKRLAILVSDQNRVGFRPKPTTVFLSGSCLTCKQNNVIISCNLKAVGLHCNVPTVRDTLSVCHRRLSWTSQFVANHLPVLLNSVEEQDGCRESSATSVSSLTVCPLCGISNGAGRRWDRRLGERHQKRRLRRYAYHDDIIVLSYRVIDSYMGHGPTINT